MTEEKAVEFLENVSETLLDPSGVLLFGRLMKDLVIAADKTAPSETVAGPEEDGPPPRVGGNRFLEEQLKAGADPRLARIYGFSYEGHYYDLAQPAIFLVHGPGTLVEGPVPGPARPESRWSRSAPTVSRTGVAARPDVFADDIRVWAYDKGDFSIRLDIETGPLKDILLDAEQIPERAQLTYAGATARLYAGATARLYSGATARLRGGRRGPMED